MISVNPVKWEYRGNEKSARREQIITYLNESKVKMCSRPQTEMVAKAIVVSKTGKLGASPSTPAKKQLYKSCFFVAKMLQIYRIIKM